MVLEYRGCRLWAVFSRVGRVSAALGVTHLVWRCQDPPPSSEMCALQGVCLCWKVTVASLKFTSDRVAYILFVKPAPLIPGKARPHPTKFRCPWGGPPTGESLTAAGSSLVGVQRGWRLIPAQLSPGCSPRKCGRGVSDAIITRDEARRIRRYTCL